MQSSCADLRALGVPAAAAVPLSALGEAEEEEEEEEEEENLGLL